jgi:hypothetical protein
MMSLEGPDRVGNRTKSAAHAAIVMKAVDAESRHALHRIRVVDFQVGFEIPPVLVAHGAVDQLLELRRVQRGQGQAANVAVDANHGRQPGGQVQVRGIVFHCESQQFGDIHIPSLKLPGRVTMLRNSRRAAVFRSLISAHQA